jgi:hypothetical protein
VTTTARSIFVIAFLSHMGWTHPAQAQLGVGTTWVRTQGGGQVVKILETWVRK